MPARASPGAAGRPNVALPHRAPKWVAPSSNAGRPDWVPVASDLPNAPTGPMGAHPAISANRQQTASSGLRLPPLEQMASSSWT